MVDKTILNIIRDYLQLVHQAGIHTSQAVLFGSYARGEAGRESDIDLLVIAPEFDTPQNRKFVNKLCELRVALPEAWRIEPIACGERQWLEDGATPIIEIARQEGQVISFTPEAA